MTPFFSVIIPVYNVASYLCECLDSVLTQTFTDWECICVDDGSTDGSGSILDEYASKDSRFRVIHQPNAGASFARNRGLAEIKGKWVWFVDSDDRIKPYALERFAAYEPKADVVYFSMELFYSDEYAKRYILPAQSKTELDDHSSEKLFGLTENSLCVDAFGWTCDKFIRSSLFEDGQIRFPEDINLFEDEIFALNLFQVANSFGFIQDVFYSYRKQGNGWSARNSIDTDYYLLGSSFYSLIDSACYKGLKKIAVTRARRFLCKALGQCHKTRTVKALFQLFKDHGDLLEQGDRFTRFLVFCSGMPDWVGAPIFVCAYNAKKVLRRIFG